MKKQNYILKINKYKLVFTLMGEATSDEYNASIPPHPDPHHPEDHE